MTRIIGGTAGGRRLETPKGQATRPTSDRVREALFSAIESWCGSLDGLRFLDLYAGSGAVGLEALSRGAGVATFVEQDRRTASLISRNARALGFAADVIPGSVGTVLSGAPRASYDVVFLDPPYPLPDADVDADLAALVAHGWLAADALVVVERASKRSSLTWPAGIDALRERKYGETLLRYGHAASPAHGDHDADPGE
ncbi:16S rRNA (guanine(966)-N(2))-methyltransferase RsmD [Nocardioides jiangxiensis]|uniref:16S rRNA (Guanine(966)-N(2))-methyltransferase RsmD n=1 Tax=Nocardioides jiangxiensis TaxID=3064524 RepID=A0ABT9B2T6_9ACTN|nr:16S rRNA (guanine(966)-N(2))-methyltransferase RsmD [Nocardioides sp. WY-20]MDO7869165.1 16S rRNA (guanine(966)-N(2))-methyltransferase RsmD [Nocardioides sp. WY-20]